MIIIHNGNTSDGLTNGQMGQIVDVIRTKEKEVDNLVVKLNDTKAGNANRRKYQRLTLKYPGAVIIERSSVQYSIRQKGGAVGSYATLVQFPVKLAHVITAHKIKGQTIPKPLKVALYINSIFEESQGHVMLSRVQELLQVYIKDIFD